MLPHVWSLAEFKEHSSKVFCKRSEQLKAIDRALERAHLQNPATVAGENAVIELLEAIAAWRKFKLLQGKESGRARAVDQLLGQLCSTAETIYRRKIEYLKPVPLTRFGVPKRDPTQERLYDYLAQAMIDQRRKVMCYDDEDLFEDLDARQKGRLAARWMLAVPDTVKDVGAARGEALRVLAAMLGNDVSVIKNLLKSNLEVVVVPRDQGTTVLDQFESIRGHDTFDGRSWDEVRGVGNVWVDTAHLTPAEVRRLEEVRDKGKGPGSIVAIDPAKGRVYTAITEENLLGGLTTAPGAGCYDTGYSTTTHEFAHSVHQYGLTDVDRATINRAYKIRVQQRESEEWVDGPRKVGTLSCYASMTVFEYFAQLSNAYLEVNTGDDPYTHKPRHNGKKWVYEHEPKMVSDILDRVYGGRALEDLNPEVILRS